MTFALEIDLFGAIHTPETYFTYTELTVPVGESVTHVFPEGFAAHWIRLARTPIASLPPSSPTNNPAAPRC